MIASTVYLFGRLEGEVQLLANPMHLESPMNLEPRDTPVPDDNYTSPLTTITNPHGE